MALKPDEQPTVLNGVAIQTIVNGFVAERISVPRVVETRNLFDADRITIKIGGPVRITEGPTRARAQLILADNEPTAVLDSEDANLIAEIDLNVGFIEAESAAGVFTNKKVYEVVRGNADGVVDSTRWRNFLYKEDIWLIVDTTAATAVLRATVKIIGKLDKASQSDFDALLLSKL